jgi:hypothetical protein
LQAVDLTKLITAKIEELAKLTDPDKFSDELRKYLKFQGMFHKYSASNLFSIMLHCPEATRVAGYRAWQKAKRNVKKGEKGIPIFAPVIASKLHQGQMRNEVVAFTVVYVFDISQTEGEDIPESGNWHATEKNEEVKRMLLALCKTLNIEEIEVELPGDTQGLSAKGRVLIDPSTGTRTLIHESAHELMHHEPTVRVSRAIGELEAESVAYVVGTYFGLGDEGVVNYLAIWGADGESIKKCMDRIHSCSKKIISTIEPQKDMVVDVG